MSCAHYYVGDGDPCFSMEASQVTFGRGALDEAGAHARALGLRRVALFTDPRVAALPHLERVRGALGLAGVQVAVYHEVKVEPDERSFLDAARFYHDEGPFDGAVSVGGGSVMDTAKAALLLATYPAEVRAYLNRPLGEGRPVPGPLPPHIACPTTCGTGSECTGVAVCGVTLPGGAHGKTGIAHRRLRPTLALVDPACAATLPGPVVALSGFDVLSHALESYTALPYRRRAAPPSPLLRPMSQGANPYSDLGSLEALRLCGRHLLRAARDAADDEAREGMMWAATLAGVAFGNAGVHLPHGMGYAIAGVGADIGAGGPGTAAAEAYQRPRSARTQGPWGSAPEGVPDSGAGSFPGYDGVAIPHGLSVILAAPSVFRFTAPACPERHLRAAEALGADTRGASVGDGDGGDAGEVLAAELLRLLRAADLPAGLRPLGFSEAHLPALALSAAAQERLVHNAPRAAGPQALEDLFRAALAYC